MQESLSAQMGVAADFSLEVKFINKNMLPSKVLKDVGLVCPWWVCQISLLGGRCPQCKVIPVLLEKGEYSDDPVWKNCVWWQSCWCTRWTSWKGCIVSLRRWRQTTAERLLISREFSQLPHHLHQVFSSSLTTSEPGLGAEVSASATPGSLYK